jgi:hypothetical protein
VAAKQGWLQLVLIGAAGSVLAAAVLQFVGWINLPAWWAVVSRAAATAWGWTTASTPTPHWVLAITAIAVLGWIALLVAVWLGTRKDAEQAFDMHGYDNDLFYDMRWRWKWGQGYNPYDLVPFCQKCDMQLDAVRKGGYAVVAPLIFPCPICGTVECEIGQGNTDLVDVQRSVKLLIQKNVRQQFASQRAQSEKGAG